MQEEPMTEEEEIALFGILCGVEAAMESYGLDHQTVKDKVENMKAGEGFWKKLRILMLSFYQCNSQDAAELFKLPEEFFEYLKESCEDEDK